MILAQARLHPAGNRAAGLPGSCGWNRPILLKNSNGECSPATSENVDLTERPRIDDRQSVDGRRTPRNSSVNIAEEFFNRIDPEQTARVSEADAQRTQLTGSFVTIGAAGFADSMSARAITSPFQMPDIRLQAHLARQNYRSVSSFAGGVHIRRVRSRTRTRAGKMKVNVLGQRNLSTERASERYFDSDGRCHRTRRQGLFPQDMSRGRARQSTAH